MSQARSPETCVLCGDELTNDFDRDTGICQACADSYADLDHEKILNGATAAPDEKLTPAFVPFVEFTGVVRSPDTGDRPLLVFKTVTGGSIGVRLLNGEAEKLEKQIGVFNE